MIADPNTPLTATEFANEFLALTRDMQRLVEGMDPADAHRRLEPDTWCAAEVLAHVIEAQRYWVGEARHVADSPGSAFGRTKADPHRVRWVEEHGQRGIKDLLQDLVEQAAITTESLQSLGGTDLSQTGIHHRRGDMSVAELLQVYLIEHMSEHINQIQDLIKGLEGSESQSGKAREDG